MDTPAENQKGFDEANTLNYVNNLKGKLLLIHGTNDDTVVMQQNFVLLKKFVEAEKQVDFFAYPMHKHNVLGKDRVHLMTKVLNYVIENNKWWVKSNQWLVKNEIPNSLFNSGIWDLCFVFY